jgi:hypothetical protein
MGSVPWPLLCNGSVNTFFCVVHAEELNWRQSSIQIVEGSAEDCQSADNGSGRISIAVILYQKAYSEDIAEELLLRKAVIK